MNTYLKPLLAIAAVVVVAVAGSPFRAPRLGRRQRRRQPNSDRRSTDASGAPCCPTVRERDGLSCPRPPDDPGLQRLTSRPGRLGNDLDTVDLHELLTVTRERGGEIGSAAPFTHRQAVRSHHGRLGGDFGRRPSRRSTPGASALRVDRRCTSGTLTGTRHRRPRRLRSSCSPILTIRPERTSRRPIRVSARHRGRGLTFERVDSVGADRDSSSSCDAARGPSSIGPTPSTGPAPEPPDPAPRGSLA